jgi:hypothetical protein
MEKKRAPNLNLISQCMQPQLSLLSYFWKEKVHEPTVQYIVSSH